VNAATHALGTDRSFVAAVEARLARALEGGVAARLPRARPRALARTVSGLVLAPGAKRLRPRLVLGMGAAIGVAQDTLCSIGTAAELIHAASLLHDDVVDDSAERRGRATANSVHGNPSAVLAGDLVLSLAFVEVQHLSPSVTEAAVRVIAEMSRAALDEVDVRGDAALLEGDPGAAAAVWEGIADGKTGALFGWCCAAPALAAYVPPPLARRLERFGRAFGIAFQLADDLLDVRGDATGKDRFSDLANRQPTLPLLFACAGDPEVRARAARLWRAEAPSRDAIEGLAAAVAGTGALEAAADRVAALLDEATAAVDDLAAAEPVVAWTRLLRQSVGR
jgi:heptaprenyl diphosphate synthase